MGAQASRTRDRSSDEAAIRACIQSWTRAVRAKDVEGVMAHYTPDIVTFDLAPPLQHARAEYRHGFEEWFRTWRGSVDFDVHDLHIEIGDGLAFSRSLNHLTGARTDGTDTDVWVRATICFRKVDGRWLAAHEHISVPFYMDGSERAATDLRP